MMGEGAGVHTYFLLQSTGRQTAFYGGGRGGDAYRLLVAVHRQADSLLWWGKGRGCIQTSCCSPQAGRQPFMVGEGAGVHTYFLLQSTGRQTAFYGGGRGGDAYRLLVAVHRQADSLLWWGKGRGCIQTSCCSPQAGRQPFMVGEGAGMHTDFLLQSTGRQTAFYGGGRGGDAYRLLVAVHRQADSLLWWGKGRGCIQTSCCSPQAGRQPFMVGEGAGMHTDFLLQSTGRQTALNKRTHAKLAEWSAVLWAANGLLTQNAFAAAGCPAKLYLSKSFL